MSRATTALIATSLGAIATAAWLYLDNRSLRAELASRPAPAAVATPRLAAARPPDPWSEPSPAAAAPVHSAGAAPALPPLKEESPLDRRARHQQEIAALLGRLPGETDDAYRARMAPMIATGLAVPRAHVEDLRKQAEATAHVTPDQSAMLDHAFGKVYDNLLDYTNKAIADGQVSPYEHNVAGLLQYAGGLGTMLDEANGQVGQILSGDQVKTLSDSGFDWGEYLGLEAPWEKLTPPPPKH